MKQLRYALIFALCSFAFKCKKDPPLNSIDQKDLLGKWMFVKLTDNNVTTTNASPCLADNYIEFREEGTGTISQGACIESSSTPAMENFNWSFKSSDVVDLGGDEIKIVVLNDSTLHFKRIPSTTNASKGEYEWKK